MTAQASSPLTHPSNDNTSSPLIDTHCHLDMEAYRGDLEQVLERAFTTPLSHIVCVGIDLSSSGNCIGLARGNPRLAATIGFHPHVVESLEAKDYLALERLYADNVTYVSAIGEIGLDYFHLHSPAATQQQHFLRQLDLAHEWKLPVVIHNRDADDDVLRLLKIAKPLEFGGIMHCFSGDMTFASKILDLGLTISLTGVVTFKNSHQLQEVATHIPLTSMVLETDGPYLAPHPYRGKRNEPAFLALTARKIAELRQISICQVATQTTKNAENLFGLVPHQPR